MLINSICPSYCIVSSSHIFKVYRGIHNLEFVSSSDIVLNLTRWRN